MVVWESKCVFNFWGRGRGEGANCLLCLAKETSAVAAGAASVKTNTPPKQTTHLPSPL
jgi:hypothetical protein